MSANKTPAATTVADLCQYLGELAPSSLAAEWDNVGLLVGNRTDTVRRVVTCLTITPAVAAEAICKQAELIVTHHPLPFKPLKRLTADDATGRLLLDLIRAGVAIYSAHTAFDSAASGINQQFAEGLGLADIKPLETAATEAATVGTGRSGVLLLEKTLGHLAASVKQFLNLSGLHVVGHLQTPISRVAIGCGSAGDLLDLAIRQGCQVFITGEARLHNCYEAEARRIALILTGHYASERFGVEQLAHQLAKQFPALTVCASRDERDPLAWV
jgi:dinuclear metal center YbgI/SA1388 family protein